MGGLNFFLLESRMGPDLGTEKLHLSYVKSAPSLIYLCCLMGVRWDGLSGLPGCLFYILLLGMGYVNPALSGLSLHCDYLFWTIFADGDDEIYFDADDIITHIEMVDEGWWRGQCQGKIGLFPANYVRLLQWNQHCPRSFCPNFCISLLQAFAWYWLDLAWPGMSACKKYKETNWQCPQECFSLCPKGLWFPSTSKWERWDVLSACECSIRHLFYLTCPTLSACKQNYVHSCFWKGHSQKRNTNSNLVKAEGT